MAEQNYIYNLTEPFNLEKTLFCGQAFRFYKFNENSLNENFLNENSLNPNSLNQNIFCGVVNNRFLKIEQQKNQLIFYNTTKEEFLNFWYYYFDFNNNYLNILQKMQNNRTLNDIAKSEQGIKILNQNPFETLISFIISQNNNIPRITKIINSFCKNFGEKIKAENNTELYAFPTPESLKNITLEDLSVIRSGFRAKYILSAIEKINSKEIVLEDLKYGKTDYLSAKEKLMTIKGVGPKVANCVLLFSLNFKCAFPEDVWIKRAVARLFPNGLPQEIMPYAGIVQQYIFNYARKNPQIFKD